MAALCPLREQVRRCYDHELAAFGLSRALAAPLLRIWENGEMRQNALADQLDIEGPSLVRLLDQLSALKLAVRRPDPDDQRAKTVHLTAAGVAVAKRIVPVHNRLRRRLLKHASDGDLDTCLRVFNSFLSACGRDGTSAVKGRS